MKAKLKGPIFLFLCAFFWGMAFSAQSTAGRYIGPNTFVWLRSTITCLTLLILRPLLLKLSPESTQTTASNRRHWVVGAFCGAFLVLATSLQQVGLMTTTTAKSGFITALYIVMVPVFGIFLKKRAGIRVWVSVALAVAGLYLLCITDRLAFGKGDILVLLCAVVFAVHILVVDHFSAKADGVRMSCIQFLVCGLLSGVCMLITEHPEMRLILQAWQPILYAGVFSCGVGYTLQIIGQKGTDPTVASLILSLESVVSVLAGWLLLGQRLSVRELGGCALMFAAILLAQLPERRQS